ncbi:MAG: type II toxin-antitoxin system VapC family toxin [Chthoniobacterales bacterium]|nr:type II toxin-antitoxin system VapC family toxin [Chthoniobacterales bacterium]
MKRLFADTHFYLAVLNERDSAHPRAMEYIAHAEVDELVTTAWVLLEMADGMRRPGERERCAVFVQDLRNDTHTRLVEADAVLFWRGFELYRSRKDKDWSLTDCVSFVVMNEEGIKEALTGDHHFEQAGFTALLK